jgi:hypothetical protein
LDNGSSFTLEGFTGMLKKFAQVISFAGVGAHCDLQCLQENFLITASQVLLDQVSDAGFNFAFLFCSAP